LIGPWNIIKPCSAGFTDPPLAIAPFSTPTGAKCSTLRDVAYATVIRGAVLVTIALRAFFVTSPTGAKHFDIYIIFSILPAGRATGRALKP